MGDSSSQRLVVLQDKDWGYVLRNEPQSSTKPLFLSISIYTYHSTNGRQNEKKKTRICTHPSVLHINVGFLPHLKYKSASVFFFSIMCSHKSGILKSNRSCIQDYSNSGFLGAGENTSKSNILMNNMRR